MTLRLAKPSAEQFEQWRANPMTEWVMGFLAAEMARTRRECDERAWHGPLDAAAHAAYRERHETLDWLRTLDMDTIERTLEMQE